MNFLATRRRKQLLFAALYMSEGAPIGYLWLALPTRLRAAGVSIEQVTGLTAILVIPWTFKFAWAPLVDVARRRGTSPRVVIAVAQAFMLATLGVALRMDPIGAFGALSAVLLFHAVAAATQDVAIDAWCISVTHPEERGRLNGFMQGGMLLGRSLLGGGALVLSARFGDRVPSVLLLVVVAFSLVLLLGSVEPAPSSDDHVPVRASGWLRALATPSFLLAAGVALMGGAAMKAVEVIVGPLLVDRGYDERAIGWFSAVPMILATLCGSLAGGFLADRRGKAALSRALLFAGVAAVIALSLVDWISGERGGVPLLACLVLVGLGLGAYTVASYALFMDVTAPAFAATQFSTLMGLVNGCEVWSSFVAGRLVAASGYPMALLVLSAASLCAVPLLTALRRRTS